MQSGIHEIFLSHVYLSPNETRSVQVIFNTFPAMIFSPPWPFFLPFQFRTGPSQCTQSGNAPASCLTIAEFLSINFPAALLPHLLALSRSSLMMMIIKALHCLSSFSSLLLSTTSVFADFNARSSSRQTFVPCASLISVATAQRLLTIKDLPWPLLSSPQ